MKKILLFIFCLAFIAGTQAQELSNFMNQKPIVSPEIGAKGVTFRLMAPNADTVKINGGFTPTVKMKTSFGTMDVPSSVNLKKDEKGLW